MVDNLWDDITSCKVLKNLVVIIYIFDEKYSQSDYYADTNKNRGQRITF